MDASLTQYRARLLSSGATYNLSAVPTLTRELLPVLNASNSAEFPDWHAYIRRLYSRPPYPLDLSTLTWFYWFSPLRLSAIFLCDISDSPTEAPFGTPWTGGVDAWHWGPEHVVRRAGFFVHRPPWAASSYQQSPRIEVMRVGPIEQPGFAEGGSDALWFFHAIGSGIYVPTSVFSKLVVRYTRRTSGRGLIAVPRVELVAHLPRTRRRAGPPPPPPRPAPRRRAAPLQKLTLGLQRSQPSVPDPARAARARSGACLAPPPHCASAEQFWPAMLRFELFDGRACESTAKQKRILSCANLPVPSWPGVDPMAPARKLRPRRPGRQAASLPLSLRLAVVAGAAAVVLYVAWAVYGLSLPAA